MKNDTYNNLMRFARKAYASRDYEKAVRFFIMAVFVDPDAELSKFALRCADVAITDGRKTLDGETYFNLLFALLNLWLRFGGASMKEAER